MIYGRLVCNDAWDKPLIHHIGLVVSTVWGGHAWLISVNVVQKSDEGPLHAVEFLWQSDI